MKVCKITLRQAPGGLYQVERVSNTTELSIGALVPKDRVREWCSMKRVNVDIIGLVDSDGLTADEPSQTLERVDALQLAASTMQDTGPGENPF